jgi:RND family efflux transporter MFP subunit
MTRAMRHAGIVIAALVLVTTGACHKAATEEVESETVVTVKTALATTGDIRGVVHATGLISPAPGAEVVVVAPEAARIAEVPRAVGDRVRRGDVLVRFEIPTSAAEVQRQEAELARARATLDNAKAAQTRAAELFERGVAARKEVEDAIRAVAEAQAAVAQAQASLAAARTVAARSIVRATFDGIVAKRLHNPGDLVEPTASDPVLQVIDPHRLEVVASVPLADASRVVMGAPAHAAGASMNAAGMQLKVVSTPAAVESGTATVPVRLRLLGSTNLPVGTPVQVDIDAEQHRGVVLIPAVAVVREGEETAVFVSSEGKAHRRVVEVGLTDGANVEIVSGIKAGERVIVDGQAGLPDDAAITEAPREGAEK